MNATPLPLPTSQGFINKTPLFQMRCTRNKLFWIKLCTTISITIHSNDQNTPIIFSINPTPRPPPSYLLHCFVRRSSFHFHRERKKQIKMLGVFSSAIVSPPDELVAAGCRTPSPKISSTALMNRFLDNNSSAVSVQIGDHVQLAYTNQNQSIFLPRSFAVKDEIFCLFEGVLDNLGSLRQQYGLAKSANEVMLVIEAYKALRDRAPYPPNHVVGHLSGNFAFVVFDKSTSTLFVASDQYGKVPLYWGITADGYVTFADDIELLKGACGKSLASFPQGCFFSTAEGGGLRSYENPKNKITAIPAEEEEIWGATFKVEGPAVLAATK